MFTREDYMAGRCTFQDYYLEIARESGLRLPAHLAEMARKSTDPHFNDVPLPLWDRCAVPFSASTAEALRKRGDYPTLAGGVCLLKALAADLVSQPASQD